MAHSQLASNAISFTDGASGIVAAIFPSSPESGAAAIGTLGHDSTLLSLEDVIVLRDFLTLCLEQVGKGPFEVIAETTEEG